MGVEPCCVLQRLGTGPCPPGCHFGWQGCLLGLGVPPNFKDGCKQGKEVSSSWGRILHGGELLLVVGQDGCWVWSRMRP